MAEIIFILVTVYAVYVVHSIITSKEKKKVKSSTVKAKVSVATAGKKEETKTVVKQEKPVAKKVVPAKTKAKPKPKSKAKPKSKLESGSLRNPETGEVAKIASSYRMCKRWIKDALVTEGFLEKVYKTNEVDDAAKVKIDKALVKLAKMEKYR